MKKVVLIPDSFKGTLSSHDAIRIMERHIHSAFPSCNVIEIPIADGGEGTVDSFLSIFEGKKMYVDTLDPLGRKIRAYYGLFSDFAVIEVANICGITLLQPHELNPMIATSYGLGLVIKDALKYPIKKLYIGLGGSATVDLGIGMANALGAIFKQDNKHIEINHLDLDQMTSIDLTSIKTLIKDVEIIAMTDVTNPLYGPYGAPAIFGPQKGATPEMVNTLDQSFIHFASFIKDHYGIDFQLTKGTGAAGGLGAAIQFFLNGSLHSGIETLLSLIQFDELIKDADLIMTGEGKIDAQTIHGKVISGIASHAKPLSIPVIALCGIFDGDLSKLYQMGISKVISINPPGKSFDDVKDHAKKYLSETMDVMMKTMKENIL